MGEKNPIHVNIIEPYDNEVFKNNYTKGLLKIILNRIPKDCLGVFVEKLNEEYEIQQKERDTL